MITCMNKADGPPGFTKKSGRKGPAGFVVRLLDVNETGCALIHSGRAIRLGPALAPAGKWDSEHKRMKCVSIVPAIAVLGRSKSE